MRCANHGDGCRRKMEAEHAMADVYQMVCERGEFVRFQVRREGDVERDSYRSIRAFPSERKELLVPCFPIDFRPVEKARERAGIKREVTLMVHTPAWGWEKAGVSWDDLDLVRWTATLEGREYRLADKNRVDFVSGEWLYWVIGLEAE